MTEDVPLRTTVRMSGPVNAVPADLAQQVLAVVREAVSNAVRHAAASELVITVSVGDRLVIDVSDNGVGHPGHGCPQRTAQPAERAAAVGGTFTVTANGASGTKLVWTCR